MTRAHSVDVPADVADMMRPLPGVRRPVSKPDAELERALADELGFDEWARDQRRAGYGALLSGNLEGTVRWDDELQEFRAVRHDDRTDGDPVREEGIE